jgi:hypothetical protein
LEERSRKKKTGSWKLEVGSWKKLEDGRRKWEKGCICYFYYSTFYSHLPTSHKKIKYEF